MKRIALVGMPNTGKSTLFNRLTGGNARVANWPGLTVELAESRILLGAHMVQVVDLPGIYDLTGGAEDEQVAQRFLSQTPLDALVLVLNSTQLDRQLALALQLKALAAPLLVVLNMSDEAKKHGIQIDVPALEQALGCPVLPLSAKYTEGVPKLKQALSQHLAQSPARQLHATELQAAATWHSEEQRLYAAHVRQPSQLAAGPTARLDGWVLHPWLGLPLFLLMMFILFQLTYALGTPLQDGMNYLLDLFKTDVLQPLASHWSPFWSGLLLDGVYDGVGTVLTFAPIIFLFFALMAVIEDSGYFARHFDWQLVGHSSWWWTCPWFFLFLWIGKEGFKVQTYAW